jgi:outer membrane protein, heavy metal efflux system
MRPVFPQGDSLEHLRSIDLAAFNSRLEKVIDDALINNPALRAARLKVDAADKSISINKSLDPPQVSYETMQSTMDGKTMEYSVSLQQMLPFPGKLSAKAGVEKQRKAMFESDGRTIERDLVKQIKDVFFEIYLIDRKREINSENQDFTKRFVAIASKRYEVGTGQQADILRGQTELSSLMNDAIVLKQARKSMVAMVNALANRPFASGIDLLPEIDPPRVDLTFDRLEPLALQHRPELASMKSNVAMMQAEEAMDKKEWYPDFMVKSQYRNFMALGMTSWGGMAGITLPIAPWSMGKISSAVARSKLQVRQAESEIENMRNMIGVELQDALYKVNSGNEQMQLLKATVIPQSRQTLESTLSAYQNGKTEFLMLIDAERMLLLAQERYHMAVMNQLSAVAALERAVGTDMTAILAESKQEKQQ